MRELFDEVGVLLEGAKSTTIARIGACPLANICEFTAGEGVPPCGTAVEHMSPLSLAESACARALWGAREMLLWNNKCHDDAIRLPKWMAWSEVDLAMVTIEDEDADRHFANAEDALNAYLDASSVTMNERVRMRLLQAYLPAFRRRRAQDSLHRTEVQSIQKELAATHNEIVKAPLHLTSEFSFGHKYVTGHKPCFSNEGVRFSMALRVSQHLLALRGNILLYPTNGRESEAGYPCLTPESMHETNKEHLHDAYMVVSPEVKIPTRIRSQKGDLEGRSVLTILFRDLIDEKMYALRRCEGAEGRQLYAQLLHHGLDARSLCVEVPPWLASEAEGEKLAPYQIKFLDALTNRFKERLREQRAESVDPLTAQKPIEDFS